VAFLDNPCLLALKLKDKFLVRKVLDQPRNLKLFKTLRCFVSGCTNPYDFPADVLDTWQPICNNFLQKLINRMV
jgi:hypothetical protein